MDNLTARKTTNYSNNARVIREKLKHYFSEEGKVSWQEKMAFTI